MKNYMNDTLKAMMDHLSSDEERQLRSIYEPTVVCVPPSDPCRSICVTPNGEIRIYGITDQKIRGDIGTAIYLSSVDCGLSWKQKYYSPSELGCAVFNPKSGRYIGVYPNAFRKGLHFLNGENGSYAILSDVGLCDEHPRVIKLCEESIHFLKNPYYASSCERWFIYGEYKDEQNIRRIFVFTSDDDGETWNRQILPHAPAFVVKPPHLGTRWQQHSCEPTIAELGNGKLMMLVRTSQDYHYMHLSDDRGNTWTDPVPSPFHGTITMPVLKTLSDGRIVLFWCNTQPLPELDHTLPEPTLDETAINGIWEDVFTNRDANHLAISNDGGKTWQGFRELWLNPLRNHADFRSFGGSISNDKSVHQGEIVELPYNKLLISFGQSRESRKVVILDIDWLYETKRHEDFRSGIESISTQMYVKSVLCGFHHFSGHCAYNRTNGALLIPDPDRDYEETLQICRIEDHRLVYKKQGAVWNFPASEKGVVSLELKRLSSGIRVSLTDRWLNPCDETIVDDAYVSLCADETVCDADSWHIIKIRYDTTIQKAWIYLDDVLLKIADAKHIAPNGLSYLHLQTLANEEDQYGSLVKWLDMYAELN